MAKKSWLERILTPEADRAERRSPQNFVAYRWTSSAVVHDPVRDISSTGVYIITQERWPLGTVLAMNLQKEGLLELLAERRITTHARVARHGEHGVGLTFVVPEDEIAYKWKSLMEALMAQTQPSDMTSLVQLAEAVAFFGQICPNSVDLVRHLMCERLSNHKVVNAAIIALQAQSLMASTSDSTKLLVNPAHLVRILEEGSATDEDWFQQLWCGLLLASCSSDGKDESNSKFIELFGQLTSVPARIFTVISALTAKYIAPNGSLAVKPLSCTAQELLSASGSRGAQLERDLEQLSGFGLIEKVAPGVSAMLPTQQIVITPTALGLELFARCNGHNGKLQDFYTMESPGAHVAAPAPAAALKAGQL